jgi:hypothetical protein
MIAIQGLKSFSNVIVLGLGFLQAKDISPQVFKISKKGFF